LLGSAIDYVIKIYDAFDKAGYYCQHWLLDAQTMGVPQRRERVYFVCLRKDLAKPFLSQVSLFEEKPTLNLDFNEPTILFGDVGRLFRTGNNIKSGVRERWEQREYGDTDQACLRMKRLYGKRVGFNQQYCLFGQGLPNFGKQGIMFGALSNAPIFGSK
jgi:DNA (cytosine-5)-methyltransferase 1